MLTQYSKWLLASLFSCLMLPAFSAAIEPVDGKPFRVVTESFPPYSYINQQGDIDGAVSRVVLALLNRLDVSVAVEMMPWARSYLIASTKPNVLIYSLVRNPQRESNFIWLSPVTTIDIGLYCALAVRIQSLRN
jgi:polar amino acid transport system substrate-binding protein